MKRLMYLLFLSVFIFQGCKKEDVDIRDAFVGTWRTSAVGSLSYILNGSVIATYPENFEDIEEIKKYGTGQLDFGGTLATYDGHSFLFSTERQSVTTNGITTNLIRDISGKYVNGKIVLTVLYTGTFTGQSAPGVVGTLNGTQTITYTKVN